MKSITALCLFCLLFIGQMAQAKEYKIAVAHIPPFSYEEEGVYKGILIDLTQEAMRRLGHGVTFVSYPWPRAVEYVELGLVDGLGSSSYVAREIIQVEKLVDYSPKQEPWQKIVDQLGVSFAKALSTQLGIDHSASPLR